jgi:15-cis-phytoene desaturase
MRVDVDDSLACLPCSMESAVRSGFLAAERVLESLGIHANIAAPLPEAEGLAAVVQRVFATR